MSYTIEEKIKNENELEEQTNKIKLELLEVVANKFKEIMYNKGLKQQDVCNRCKKIGFNLAPSTLSNILSLKSNSNISLVQFIKICEVLEIDVAETISEFSAQKEKSKYLISPPKPDFQNQESYLIFSPKDDAYRGYIQKYYCYFFPTISNETGLLQGELTLDSSHLKDECSAKFQLYTNPLSANGVNCSKEYEGQFVISERLRSCYCLLYSFSIGEICMINFHHLHLNQKSLECRLATVVTTSAGGNRRPCMHRMLLSQKPLNIDDLELLKSQLLLNNSDIMISVDRIEELGKNYPEIFSEDILKHLKSFPPINYYKLSEEQIKRLKLSDEDRIRAICFLRNYSTASKYNKVGTKSDELVFDYINKIINEV